MKYEKEYITVPIHDFKTHISRYIRLMEQGKIRYMMIRRGKKPVALFTILR